jgi:hypothetical protein
MREHEFKAIQEMPLLTVDQMKALGFKLYFITTLQSVEEGDNEWHNVLVHWCVYRPEVCNWPANRFTQEEARSFTDWLLGEGERGNIQIKEMLEYTEEDSERDFTWYNDGDIWISKGDDNCPLEVFGLCAPFPKLPF